MRRYIVLYQAPVSVAARFAQATPEEAMKGMQLWVDWTEKVGTALVDPGKPLGHAIRITKSGSVNSESTIIGMSILQADSMDAARAMVEHHHHLYWADGCEIVVLEEMAIPELEGAG